MSGHHAHIAWWPDRTLLIEVRPDLDDDSIVWADTILADREEAATHAAGFRLLLSPWRVVGGWTRTATGWRAPVMHLG